MRQAIISNINGDKFTGYLVNHAKHYVILGPIEGLVDEIIADYPDERGVVVSGESYDALLFKDEDGMYVCLVGHEGNGRSVKSIPGALKVLSDYLTSAGETLVVNQIQEALPFYTNYLANLMDEKV